MTRYLGIDCGTTKIAAVVLDTATGRLEAVRTATTPGRKEGAGNRSEWDIDEIVRACLATARAAVVAAGAAPIAAIGVTGQMHGMLLVDAANRPLSPFIGWQDKRCDEPLGPSPSAIAWLRQLAGPDASGRTGCTLASGFLGATLFWLRRTGHLQGDAVAASTLPDYLVALLTDQSPITDPTNAAGAGLYNLRDGSWDRELLVALELPAALLPAIRPTGARAGGLAAAMAARLGLPAGTPVANALGDNQASFLGSVARPADDLLINVGAGGQVSAAGPLVAPRGRLETRPYVDDRCLLVGAGEVGGTAYRLVHDFLREVGREVFGATADDLYPALNRLAAAAPPGSDGLRSDPRFLGTRTEPARRGGFSGLAPATFKPGHLARAVLEGMAERCWELAEEMRAAGLSPRRRLIGSGNGLRRNPVLVDVLERRFQADMVMPIHTEEAAFGAALIAGVADGGLDWGAAGDLISYGASDHAAPRG